jgi:hypothetical protein
VVDASVILAAIITACLGFQDDRQVFSMTGQISERRQAGDPGVRIFACLRYVIGNHLLLPKQLCVPGPL